MLSEQQITTCSKCGETSGNDWSQCQGLCPMPASPHYQTGAKAMTLTPEQNLAVDAAIVEAIPSLRQTQTLEQMSAAATQGEWTVCEYDAGRCIYDAGGFPTPSIQCEEADCAIVHWDGFKQEHWVSANGNAKQIEANASFIVALVNAYRTGQLVEVQADDATVERVARAIRDVKGGVNYDYLDFCRDAATAAIAAMPSQAALQAEIDRLRMELQNIAETTDDEITSRQAFVALSKGPRP